jgi:hypothetical protein
MRGMWLLVGAIVLIAAAWLGDRLVESLVRQGAGQFDMTPALTVSVLSTPATMAGVLGLGWLALRGPRGRLAGAVMLIIGAWIALLPLLVWLNIPQAIGLTAFIGLVSPRGDLIVWASAGVAVIGALCLARPTPTPPAATPAHAGAA